MKKLILAALTAGALLMSSVGASAFMGGKEAGSICIFGQDVHCWIDPATYSWQKDHPAFASNEVTEPQSTIARRGRGSTCAPNPYGRRSMYCNENEVEAPVMQSTASAEFGQCLLNDAPVDLEKLTGCRSDACVPNPYFNHFKYYR